MKAIVWRINRMIEHEANVNDLSSGLIKLACINSWEKKAKKRLKKRKEALKVTDGKA